MWRLARLSPVLLLLLLLAAPLLLLRVIRPVALLNWTIPRRGLKVRRNVAFGPDPRQRLDLYRPAAVEADLPVVVFFYGGGWDKGRRGDYLFVAEALARAGHLVVVPDYRLYPAVRFPTFIEDCAKAVAWAVRHAAEHGGEPRRLFLVGHSAGAFNAAFIALDPQWLAAEGLTPAVLSGVAGLAGPYAFDPLGRDDTRPIFESGRPSDELQPVTFAATGQARGAPPFLLLHGAADTTVEPRNSRALAAALRAAGVSVEFRSYEALGHVGIVLALARGGRRIAPVRKTLTAFLKGSRAAGAAS